MIVFHVQDAAELNFPFEGATLFQDLETGEELEIDPAAVRKTYLERMEELSAFYRKGLTEIGVDYHLDRHDATVRPGPVGLPESSHENPQ